MSFIILNMSKEYVQNTKNTIFIESGLKSWSKRRVFVFLLCLLHNFRDATAKFWYKPVMDPDYFALFLYKLFFSSSTNNLKAPSVSSFQTTELQRGCGRSASNTTPSSGKSPAHLIQQTLFLFLKAWNKSAIGVIQMFYNSNLVKKVMFFSTASCNF